MLLKTLNIVKVDIRIYFAWTFSKHDKNYKYKTKLCENKITISSIFEKKSKQTDKHATELLLLIFL